MNPTKSIIIGDYRFRRPSFLLGMASVLDIGATLRGYKLVVPHNEVDSLWNDWEQVGDALKTAIEEYRKTFAKYPNSDSSEQIVFLQQKSIIFSGLLPSPEVLEKFEMIVRGSAERLISIAEKKAIVRTELEVSLIHSDIERAKFGQVFGFVISITGLIGAGIIAVYGNSITGGILGVGTLASLVGVFMYGSKTDR